MNNLYKYKLFQTVCFLYLVASSILTPHRSNKYCHITVFSVILIFILGSDTHITTQHDLKNKTKVFVHVFMKLKLRFFQEKFRRSKRNLYQLAAKEITSNLSMYLLRVH